MKSGLKDHYTEVLFIIIFGLVLVFGCTTKSGLFEKNTSIGKRNYETIVYGNKGNPILKIICKYSGKKPLKGFKIDSQWEIIDTDFYKLSLINLTDRRIEFVSSKFYQSFAREITEDKMTAETGPKTSKLIDDITKKITIYRFIDSKSFEYARNITKVNKSIADKLVKALNNIKYSQNIRTLLKLFLDDIKHKNQICGKEYEKYLRSLMSIKRTSQEIYFKQQISVLVDSLVKDIKEEKMYNSLTKQTQFLINLFIAYYITLLVRRTICLGV